MIKITTIEHGIASAVRDVVIGARATQKFIETKVEPALQNDAPAIEKLTALVDPRAADAERVGFAALGVLLPQIDKAASETAKDGSAPTVTLTVELFNDLKALGQAFAAEIAGAKASVAATPAPASK